MYKQHFVLLLNKQSDTYEQILNLQIWTIFHDTQLAKTLLKTKFCLLSLKFTLTWLTVTHITSLTRK